MAETIQFELNGKKVEIPLEKNQTLLWALRINFNLTGTKYGCGLGYCGTCTVLMDNEPVRSCGILMEDVAGKKITTIEGMSVNGKLHPIQQAFVDHDALQCGYCTPGMIMNAYGLLLKNPNPTKEQIVDGMEGNLCRCGAHTHIIDAIESASKKMKI
ncbi:MAG: (2Fe-2S)-binding protein [Bacteroidota bacterium]|jgi:carbon-monoxide dehydrogenase small subunit|nr:(2Fe-2S)-binding protein [Bacteroidota bacterium]MDP3433929.1 (2Fe-2S)-binding protein [Bacteroidota bacterium]MDP3916526.1 (2Fe-2S)-binding protein [Bacteroidota bacterium]